MTDTPDRQSVIVGIFVILALLLLAGGILTIGRINAAFTRTITVTAVFDEVGGLKAGDKVWFSGLEVGTVDDLGFAGDGVQVELAVARDAARHIPGDALAKIGSDGLIGNKIVVLYDGTARAGALTDGAVVAIGDTVSTEDMLATFQENNANVLAITNDLKALTARLAAGEGTVGKLLADEELGARVERALASLEDASANAERLTASLSTFAGNLNREGTLPHDLVTDDQLYASITASVQGLETTADRAASLVTSLEEAARSPDSAIGTLLQDEGAGADLRQTLANLNESSRLMSENLEALKHNFLLRGFFRKKDKRGAEEHQQAPAPPAPPAEPAPEPPPSEPPASG